MQHNEPPDALLISRIASGDAPAFRLLMSRHLQSVFRTALRCTGNHPDAEDIAQETFLQVWRKAGSFRGRSSVTTWLYRIVINRCLNHRRKHRREPLLQNRPMGDDVPGSADADPLASAERRENLRLVDQAVRALPGRQAAALILTQLERRSYREVAEILETTVPAVESLVSRAKAALRRRLAGRAGSAEDRESRPGRS